MQYGFLKGTRLNVSRVSLGTMMFGGQTSEADSLSIMDYAFEKGVNVFDTANVYNQGESERITGKGLKGRREKIILATKTGNRMGNDPNDSGLSRRNIFRSVDASLKRLNTDYIDLCYLHLPDYQTNIEETLEAMSSLVSSGRIHYIGVSNYAAWQIADMLAVCDKRGYVAPLITQNVYNLLTRGIEGELIPFIRAHNMNLTVYNPIAGGLLTGKHKTGAPPEGTRFGFSREYSDRYWTDVNFRAVEELSAIAREYDMDILKLAMKWVDSRGDIVSILSGVSRLSQLEQNLAIFDSPPLPDEIFDKCDEVWRRLPGDRFAYNR
ncbi:MAG: aldo/keto reductase [Spirochaetaceae bacterium]|jgi:aryl-alcohol dehydrogenase-like predicted oxidoreductase|nr:aldo/keto reductase [Spirochaetaceae bacterium]